ncbi:RNA-directed DNA polymerase, eukaryota, reverse transcriptase zinc-binding domain protein [Tanacetum coccineum]
MNKMMRKMTQKMRDLKSLIRKDIGGSDEGKGAMKNKVSMVPLIRWLRERIPNLMMDNKESSTKESLEYPPGFTPREDVVENVEMDNQRKSFDCDFGNKLNSMVSDYFVMIRGNWVTNGKLLLIILVYTPQELSEKKLLWDYLGHVIANWKCEVIIMGDFNEVRNKNERFGIIFNVQGANAFNSFISMANLDEVPLGGCSYTWCHRSASNMSKLDRFLMSESLLRECPNFSAITLDRYLSDHRPILLRESTHDYGPIPFWFFYYWLEMKGFENFVNEVWPEAPVDTSNAMINLMNKLKYLKKKIRVWNGMRQSPKNRKYVLKQELAELEMVIDKGDASNDILNKRMEVVKSIQKVNKLYAMEATQKAKIKWAIECDENSKYCHGILNKKRNQLFVCGVLVEGNWEESPYVLNSMQQLDLEAEVSNEEIKKAVWDCGIDESSGPNGFTFSFYKRFPKQKWCGWIQECLRSSWGSVLVNGSPTEEFQFCKGLKQGDPLSPFIFILVMESLHLSFKRVVDAGMFNGIVLDSSMQLSHMFYADDMVFMGQWSIKNIDTIIYVLKCFQRASGLSIKLSKSKLLGIAVSVDRVEQAVNRIGCRVLKVPLAYLGSKVGGNMSWIQSWDEIVEKMAARLSKWKMKTLSIGGRLTLLKAILGSMPIYHMSIFKVIKAIHGEDGKNGRGSKKKLGNGADTYFWDDLWRGDMVLKQRYPRLYALELNKKVDVASKLSQESWLRSFRRAPRSGVEQSHLIDLMAYMEGVVLGASPDRWYWALEGSGDFLVTSVRKVIDGNRLPDVSSQTRWIKAVPIKICHWWDVEFMEVRLFDDWKSWIANLRMPIKHKRLLEGRLMLLSFVPDMDVFGYYAH